MKSGSAVLDGTFSGILVGFILGIHHGSAIFVPLEAVFLQVGLLLAVLASHVIVWGAVTSIRASRGSFIGRAEQGGLSSPGADCVDGLSLIIPVLTGGGLGSPMAATVMGLAALLSCWMISKSKAAS